MQLLNALQQEIPKLKVYGRQDSEYLSRRRIYNSAIKTHPLAVAVPQTAEEVAAIVKFAGRNDLPFSVRSGGHDLCGRSLVEDALVIDMRALNTVEVDKDGGTARIGGGIQSRNLSLALAEHGCLTPCPNIATIGYIGYATTGGYGQMAQKYGLGVDHLLGARIVTATGDIVTANDRTMKGIRGAGGNFGIIVEATIKIYPFAQILAGIIIFESSDYQKSMNAVQSGWQSLAASNDLPPELDIQPFYSYLPPAGKIYAAMFMWAGPDIDRGKQYLEKICSFHPVIHTTVTPVSMQESLERNAPYVPESSYMNSRTVNVRRITPKIHEIFTKACASMPADPAAMLTWHQVRGCSPSCDKGKSLDSVFNAREAHYVIQILGNAVHEENFQAVSEWAVRVRDELVREVPEEILESNWLASTPNEEIGSLEKLVGRENVGFLRELKKEMDPKGVFRYALPDLTAL